MNALLALFAASLTSLTPPPAVVTLPDKGPETVLLNQVPGCYGSVRFDHRLHVNMSTMGAGCTYCHHTETYEPCRKCHEATSAAVSKEKLGLRGAYHQQCLSCHKSWAHENACGFCHTPSGASRSPAMRTMSMPHTARSSAQPSYVYNTSHKSMPVVTFHHEDHAKVFGLRCTDCHEGTSCGQCHGPTTTRPVINRQQTCYRCHAETRCVTCHNLAEQPRFDHALNTGWTLRPGHDRLACSECHESTVVPTRPDGQKCQACHAAQAGGFFDHAQTGVVLYGDHALFSCVECHTRNGEHALANCSGCHSTRPVTGHRDVGRPLSETRRD